MIEFLYHDGIQKEIAALERRFRTLDEGFAAFERLCEVQFNTTNPRQVIAPAKLHRIKQNDNYNDANMNCLASSRVSDFF